jgi:hypothetical protein
MNELMNKWMNEYIYFVIPKKTFCKKYIMAQSFQAKL